MVKNISNHEKNKEAQILLIDKLQQLGAQDISAEIKNHRRFIEVSIQGKKKIIYYNSKTMGDWQLNLNHSEDCDPLIRDDRFWILVDMEKNRFFVTPERWLAKNIFDAFSLYKKNHGGKRPVNNDSKHHKISEHEIKQWEEAWEIIFEKPINYIYDDEIQPDTQYIEGSVTSVKVNLYERNQAARRECLDLMGYNCIVCNINFKDVYGDIGESFIHVHHKVELSSIKESYSIDPRNDLVPVCPNCHAMLHKRKPAFAIEELKKIIMK
jgi:hypothetical protein